MALILLNIIVLTNSLNFNVFAEGSFWPCFILPPLSVAWFIRTLAETNRAPFDFVEGESELVSGFNVEYSSGRFAIIFMAEYMNIIIIRLFTAVFFTGTAICPLYYDFFIIVETVLLTTFYV